MVRSGTFGRLPRAVPSLTNTLLAIAREQMNNEDSNLMSAWAKGGMFKGQKATDDFVLKYWRKRVDGVSKDDPLYDTYKNAVTQYEYTIAESKKTAAYAQIASPTGGDDSAMASFYMGWAKKIPKDSEFYRVLLRDAGQYMRSAAAKRKQVTQRDTEKAYQARMTAIENRDEKGGQMALDYVTRLMQEGAGGRGALLGQTILGNYRDSMNQTNITKLDLSDIDGVDALIASVNDEAGKGIGSTNVLFYGADDKPVRGVDIINALKAANPGFNGSFDLASLRQFVVNQKDGLAKRMALAKSTGHMSDYQALSRDLERVDEYDEEIQATPVLAKYANLKSALDATLRDTSLSPQAQIAAIDKIRSKMGALADDPSISTDGHLQSQLRGEAEGTAGTVTIADDMQGFADTGAVAANKTTSVEFVQNFRDIRQANLDLLADPRFAMTQGDYQPDGSFIPSAGGHEYGSAPVQAIQNMPNGNAGKPVTVMVSDGAGGMFPVVMAPVPITATATGADGTTIHPDSSKPAGSFIRYIADGQTVTLYKITDQKNGMDRWSPDPPVDLSLVKSRETANGIVWDFSDAIANVKVPDKLQNDMELVPGSGIYLRNYNNQTGKGGTWQMDGQRAAWFTVQDRAAAGFDANTDSYSPTLAGVIALPDGKATVAKYKDDPSFLKLIDSDNRRAAGFTEQFDPKTGASLWTGGDDAKYAEAGGKALFAIRSAVDPQGLMVGDRAEKLGYWDKTQTALTPVGAYVAPVTETKLPTDTLRGVADSYNPGIYGALSLTQGVTPGSNQFDLNAFRMSEKTGNAPKINTGISLTIPGVTPFGPPAPPPVLPTTVNPSQFTASASSYAQPKPISGGSPTSYVNSTKVKNLEKLSY